jgi:hypothetical protein
LLSLGGPTAEQPASLTGCAFAADAERLTESDTPQAVVQPIVDATVVD